MHSADKADKTRHITTLESYLRFLSPETKPYAYSLRPVHTSHRLLEYCNHGRWQLFSRLLVHSGVKTGRVKQVTTLASWLSPLSPETKQNRTLTDLVFDVHFHCGCKLQWKKYVSQRTNTVTFLLNWHTLLVYLPCFSLTTVKSYFLILKLVQFWVSHPKPRKPKISLRHTKDALFTLVLLAQLCSYHLRYQILVIRNARTSCALLLYPAITVVNTSLSFLIFFSLSHFKFVTTRVHLVPTSSCHFLPLQHRAMLNLIFLQHSLSFPSCLQCTKRKQRCCLLSFQSPLTS